MALKVAANKVLEISHQVVALKRRWNCWDTVGEPEQAIRRRSPRLGAVRKTCSRTPLRSRLLARAGVPLVSWIHLYDRCACGTWLNKQKWGCRRGRFSPPNFPFYLLHVPTDCDKTRTRQKTKNSVWTVYMICMNNAFKRRGISRRKKAVK